MLFQIKSYCRFLLHSTNQYGVHSPFVFDLLVKCIYDSKRHNTYELLEKYRNSLLVNNCEIEVRDFGAGSRVFNSPRRKISAIAKNAGISSKRSKMLYRISRYFKPQNILEIGTSVGLATAALHCGNPEANITTVEGCEQTSNVASEQFMKFGFTNTKFVVSEFDHFLKTVDSKYDLIYFDGNHQKEATLSYFETLLATTTNNTVWIFDDIHWSNEMQEAWEIIIKNPLVRVSIDSYQWGFVFFRKEQEKQHFIVRV